MLPARGMAEDSDTTDIEDSEAYDMRLGSDRNMEDFDPGTLKKIEQAQMAQ